MVPKRRVAHSSSRVRLCVEPVHGMNVVGQVVVDAGGSFQGHGRIEGRLDRGEGFPQAIDGLQHRLGPPKPFGRHLDHGCAAASDQRVAIAVECGQLAVLALGIEDFVIHKTVEPGAIHFFQREWNRLAFELHHEWLGHGAPRMIRGELKRVSSKS